MLKSAIEDFQRGHFADALIAAEYVCRRHADAPIPMMLRARITEACYPQLTSKAWYRAWSVEPMNAALQDAMLRAWLQAGAVDAVRELGPAFLPGRCEERSEASLLALLREAGIERVGACWKEGNRIAGAVFQLAANATNTILAIFDGNQERHVVVPAEGSRFTSDVDTTGLTLSIAYADSAQILQGSPLVFAPKSANARRAQRREGHAPERVDIVIPVYRGFSAVKACIESVLATLPLNKVRADVVIVDDASPEPELVTWLNTLVDNPRVTLLRNRYNLGFIETVNRGLRLHPDRDILLLNADTLVNADWIDRLRASLYSAKDIASVTPWSNNGEITSLYGAAESAPPPTADQLERIDAIAAGLRRDGRTDDVELPTCCGFAMLIRRSVMNQIGFLDGSELKRGYGEEVDWCLRARAAGHRHLAATGVFVAHTGTVSFRFEKTLRVKQNRRVLEARYPAYYSEYQRFLDQDPLQFPRKALSEALRESGDEWLTAIDQRAQSGIAAMGMPLVASCKRIAVWNYHPASPAAPKFLAIARAIAARNLPVRLLVLGDALESFWHTGVVDVIPSQPDGETKLFTEHLIVGLADCSAVLAAPGQEPELNMETITVDNDFNPANWLDAWVERHLTQPAVQPAKTSRRKHSLKEAA